MKIMFYMDLSMGMKWENAKKKYFFLCTIFYWMISSDTHDFTNRFLDNLVPQFLIQAFFNYRLNNKKRLNQFTFNFCKKHKAQFYVLTICALLFNINFIQIL